VLNRSAKNSFNERQIASICLRLSLCYTEAEPSKFLHHLHPMSKARAKAGGRIFNSMGANSCEEEKAELSVAKENNSLV